jgi:hypothetical protein
VRLVETLHLWFNVSGDPGVLARWAAPTGEHPLVEIDCASRSHHCAVPFAGGSYDYSGHISRDQYQGVMLGYALAYQALGDANEATRALIREDVVELITELMRERSVPLQITWNGTDWPRQDITARFMVLCTREMTDGAIHITLDTGDFSNSEIWGFQEFLPNWGDMLSQVPGFGWLTNVPRADSAIMLPSFFRVALLVTAGVPGYEAQHAAIREFYRANPPASGGNVSDWLGVADGWFYSDTCGNAYYANNIAMQPLYNWARLEDDAGIRARILDDVFLARMWPDFARTKNPFFSYIYGAIVAAPDPTVAAGASAQLAQFPPPPRVAVAVDLRDDPRYQPHESGCTDQTNRDTAVEVGERVVSDFLWQRHPWGLFDPGDPHVTYPGVDFLLAYWLGRFQGFLGDDTPGRCLAWR